MKLKFTFFILGVMFIAFACQKNNEDNKVYQYQTLNLPLQADNYKADFDAAFGTSKMVNMTTTNAITNDGAALGRVLFYEIIVFEQLNRLCKLPPTIGRIFRRRCSIQCRI
jgi:hypothetical protein